MYNNTLRTWSNFNFWWVYWDVGPSSFKEDQPWSPQASQQPIQEFLTAGNQHLPQEKGSGFPTSIPTTAEP